MAATTTPKRRRLNCDDSDEELDDPTPRALPSMLSLSSSGSSVSGSRGSSRTSSPRKKLATLGLREDGIKCCVMGTGMSAELVAMVTVFTAVRSGNGVVPAALQAQLDQEAGSNPSIPPRYPHYFSHDAGYTLDGDSLLGVVDWASKCQAEGASEATWNAAVHFPLLRLALYCGSRIQCPPLVDFVLWWVQPRGVLA